MMFKRYFTTALSAALLFSATASAQGAASQFGYAGWPNRHPIQCRQDISTTLPPESGNFGSVSAPNSTPEPTNEPCDTTFAPQETPAPTQAPQQTATPGPRPTATMAPSSDDDYTTVSISMQEQSAWNLLNSDRKANGLPSLPLDAELSRIARIKAEDMRDRGYFAHQSPTYGSPSEMLRHFGYSFSAAGENIAHHANITKAQAAFMSSDGHRRNILSASWTRVGIGVCYDAQGYVYVTQLFAR